MELSKRHYVDSKRIDIFQNAERIRTIVREHLGLELAGEQILAHMYRIKNYHYSKNRKISEEEDKVRKYLIANGYNIETSLNWIKATLLPEELKEKLANKELSMHQSFRVKKNLDDRRKANICLEIIELGKEIVDELVTNLRNIEKKRYPNGE